jgi:HlyD family secretion protein
MIVKRILLGALLAALIAATVGASWFYYHREPLVKLPGVVEIQEVRLSSKVGGRVNQVLAQEGTVVSAGQPLVIFDVPEWEAKHAQLQAQLLTAKAQLEKAQNGALPEEKASAKANAEMAKARLLRLKNGSRPEEIEAAHKDWTALKAEVERAEKDWKRELLMRSKGATSGYQAEAALAAFLKSKDQASAAHERWKMLEKGPRVEEIAEAEADVARLQAQFDLLQRGTRSEEIAEAEARVLEIAAKLKENDVQLNEAVVVAPAAARIEVVAVRPGDVIAANQTVVRILLAEDLWVKAYIPEPMLGKVGLNQEVRVTNDSFGAKEWKGIVTHIASASEFTPRNVQSADERCNQVFAIKIRVHDTAAIFKSGMAAEVIVPMPQN